MRMVAFLVLAAAGVAAAVPVPGKARTPDQPSAGESAGAPAAAPQVEDLFTRFGLFGTWAADCGRKPAPANPHVTISNPGPGLVYEEHDLGGGFAVNRYTVLSAAALSPTRLSVEVVFQPGKTGEERQLLVFRIHDRTRRTLFNQPEGGPVRVKDGVALARRTRTPLLRKCE